MALLPKAADSREAGYIYANCFVVPVLACKTGADHTFFARPYSTASRRISFSIVFIWTPPVCQDVDEPYEQVRLRFYIQPMQDEPRWPLWNPLTHASFLPRTVMSRRRCRFGEPRSNLFAITIDTLRNLGSSRSVQHQEHPDAVHGAVMQLPPYSQLGMSIGVQAMPKSSAPSCFCRACVAVHGLA